jgi:hypothetical protein
MRVRLGVLVVLAAAAALAAALVLSGSARSSPAASPSVAAVYSIKIGIKGGASSADKHTGTQNGDMVSATLSHSFSIDGTISQAVIVGGPPKRGLPTFGAGYARATVNGTWTARGTKWVDIVNHVTGPFTCTGTIRAHVTPQMMLSWKRRGAVLQLTLAAAQQELYDNGLDGCPSGTSGDPVSGTQPTVYETRFSLPLAAIGHKTITVQVSGPLPEARSQMLHNCASVSVSNCAMAWHGVVRFSLKRLMKFP